MRRDMVALARDPRAAFLLDYQGENLAAPINKPMRKLRPMMMATARAVREGGAGLGVMSLRRTARRNKRMCVGLQPPNTPVCFDHWL